jgi:hypothetical protein
LACLTTRQGEAWQCAQGRGRPQQEPRTALATAQQGQQQAQAATQQQQAAFGKARAACLEGKGYTVK